MGRARHGDRGGRGARRPLRDRGRGAPPTAQSPARGGEGPGSAAGEVAGVARTLCYVGDLHRGESGATVHTEAPPLPSSCRRRPLREGAEEALGRGYVAAYRLLGNADEAREACQEAAARALAARDRYDATRPFYPWFHRILRNLCIDRRKARSRIAPDPPREGCIVEATGSAEAVRAPDLLVAASEEERAVAAAIDRMPEDLRAILEMRHFEDMSYEEMAAALECPSAR